jgi:hypothetical protein
MGCVANLGFWGYKDDKTTRSSFRQRGDLNSTKFFDTCREMDNIQAMLADNSWATCMKRLVPQFSYPSDAGRFCVAEQTKASLASAPRQAKDQASTSQINDQKPQGSAITQ